MGTRSAGRFSLPARRPPLQEDEERPDLLFRDELVGVEESSTKLELSSISSSTLPVASTRCSRVGTELFSFDFDLILGVLLKMDDDLRGMLPRISTASLNDTDLDLWLVRATFSGTFRRFIRTTHSKKRFPNCFINDLVVRNLMGVDAVGLGNFFSFAGGGDWIRRLPPFCRFKNLIYALLLLLLLGFCFFDEEGDCDSRGRPRLLGACSFGDFVRRSISESFRRLIRTVHSLRLLLLSL